jgi:hypothetical protein
MFCIDTPALRAGLASLRSPRCGGHSHPERHDRRLHATHDRRDLPVHLAEHVLLRADRQGQTGQQHPTGELSRPPDTGAWKGFLCLLVFLCLHSPNLFHDEQLLSASQRINN